MRPSLKLGFFYVVSWLVFIAGCNNQAGSEAPSETASASYPDFSDVIQQVEPAVVLIRGVYEHNLKNQISGGSGVIISEDGYIVTNNHVVDKTNQIKVTCKDNYTYVAKVIGTDPETDLALLKIEATNKLPYLKFGDSDKLQKGNWVLTIGHPLNLPFTVTQGIISAKDRMFNKGRIEDFIQTDAAINAGNSGGALINLKGELVGITSSSITTTGDFVGYTLAIPSSIVKPITEELKQKRTVQHAILGISARTVNSGLVEAKKLKQYNGVYVRKVDQPGPAAVAGIHRGDVIVAMNNVEIENLPQLLARLVGYHPGELVTVTVDRKGEKFSTTITLQEDIKPNPKSKSWLDKWYDKLLIIKHEHEHKHGRRR